MSGLTAGAPGMALIDALKRAGWGSLNGPEFNGVRVTYGALVEVLNAKSSQGEATVDQIAERTGYTPRWTRRCLQVLEQLELIEWMRGGIVDGRPCPSWFRVSKRALLDLISIARKTQVERHTEKRDATRARIAKYRLGRTTRRQNRRSVHAELNTALLFIKEVPQETEPPEEVPYATEKTKSDALAQIRSVLAQRRGYRPTRGQDSKSATTTRGAVPGLPGLSPDLLARLNAYARPTGGTEQ